MGTHSPKAVVLQVSTPAQALLPRHSLQLQPWCRPFRQLLQHQQSTQPIDKQVSLQQSDDEPLKSSFACSQVQSQVYQDQFLLSWTQSLKIQEGHEHSHLVDGLNHHSPTTLGQSSFRSVQVGDLRAVHSPLLHQPETILGEVSLSLGLQDQVA